MQSTSCNGPDGPCYDGLQHRSSAVMQQMDLIDDHQPDKVGVGAIITLAGDDIPLLRCCHDYLCLLNLLLSQVDITWIAKGSATRQLLSA